MANRTVIRRLSTRLSLLKQIATQLDHDPSFRADVLSLLDHEPSQAPSPVRPRPPTATTQGHFATIRAHLEKHSDGCTVPRLVRATGLKRSQVAEVLYRSHRSKFRNRSNPSGGRAKIWTLATDGETAAKDSTRNEDQ